MAQPKTTPTPIIHHAPQVASTMHLSAGSEGVAALCAAGFLGVLYLRYRWRDGSGVDRMARAQRQQTKMMRQQYDWERQQAAGMTGTVGANVRYQAKKTYKSLIVPAGIFVAVLYVWGLVAARQTTIMWTIVAVAGALLIRYRTRAQRMWRRRVVEPLAAGLAGILGYPAGVPHRQWLELPSVIGAGHELTYTPIRLNPRFYQRAARDISLRYAEWRAERLASMRNRFRVQIDWALHHDPRNSARAVARDEKRRLARDTARIRVMLPPTWKASADNRAALVETIQQRVSGDWEPHWNFPGYLLEMAPKPQPPEVVRFADLIPEFERCADGQLILGLDQRSELFKMNLEEDDPHIAYSMGTGAGKSVALRNLIAQLIRQGATISIVDPKMVSQTVFEGVPGVFLSNDPRHVGDMWDTIGRITSVLNERMDAYARDRSARDSWNREVLIVEELNTFADLCVEYWRMVKPKGGPNKPPVWGDIAGDLRMGRELKIHVIVVGQRLDSASCGGYGLRDSFGTRVLSRYTWQQWKMLVGTSPIPRSVKKRGRMIVVAGGEQTWIQGPVSEFQEIRDYVFACRAAQGWTDAEQAPASAPRTVPSPDSPAFVPGNDDRSDAATAGEGSRSTTLTIVPETYSLADASEDRGIAIVPVKYEALRKMRQNNDDFPEGTQGRTGKTYDPDELRAWYYKYRASQPVRRTGTEG